MMDPEQGTPKPNKALAAAIVGVVAVLTQWYVSGELNQGEAELAVLALVNTVTVYWVSNR